MSTDRDVVESKKDTEGKNKDKIYCTFCPSKMLNAGVARFTNMDVSITTACGTVYMYAILKKSRVRFFIRLLFITHFNNLIIKIATSLNNT